MSNSSLVNVRIPAYSGNYTAGRSGKRIEAITIHHMAGNLSAEQCGYIFQKVGRNGSSHYGIGSDGRIGQYVDESNTAWTNSNWDSNCKSVTIETSNCEIGGNWAVSDAALNSLIRLVADIAKRNNLGTLVLRKNLTWHSLFANTSCPGPYLKSKLQYICDEANRINASGQPIPTPTEPDYTGVITYQVYDGKWEKEVNKCDNTDEGYAGDSIHFISGARAYPQFGEIIIESHELGGDWLGPVSSKDYKTDDMMNGNSYAGIYGKPQDAFRIKSTRGYVEYRTLVKNDKGILVWLDWVKGFGDNPDEYAGIFGKPIYGLQMK